MSILSALRARPHQPAPNMRIGNFSTGGRGDGAEMLRPRPVKHPQVLGRPFPSAKGNNGKSTLRQARCLASLRKPKPDYLKEVKNHTALLFVSQSQPRIDPEFFCTPPPVDRQAAKLRLPLSISARPLEVRQGIAGTDGRKAGLPESIPIFHGPMKPT